MSKTNSELIKEFLERGGIIQKIEAIPPNSGITANKANTPISLKSLSEGELLYTKIKHKKRKNKPTENIDFNYIPDHIKQLIEKSDS